jgi:hypothetical protein
MIGRFVLTWALATAAFGITHGVATADNGCPAGDYYSVASQQCVPSPEAAPADPSSATAECRDGDYSFSHHISGTCSHHGGVDHWINEPSS